MYFCNFKNVIYFQDYALQEYKDCKLIVAGDGRCDSPGSSAKFCSYSLMDVSTSKVLHVETIDKREVQLQSPNMESTHA